MRQISRNSLYVFEQACPFSGIVSSIILPDNVRNLAAVSATPKGPVSNGSRFEIRADFGMITNWYYDPICSFITVRSSLN